MKAITSFTINTDINKGEEVIDSICLLGSSITDPNQKEQLGKINDFVQNIWKQMLKQQFTSGINENTIIEF